MQPNLCALSGVDLPEETHDVMQLKKTIPIATARGIRSCGPVSDLALCHSDQLSNLRIAQPSILHFLDNAGIEQFLPARGEVGIRFQSPFSQCFLLSSSKL